MDEYFWVSASRLFLCINYESKMGLLVRTHVKNWGFAFGGLICVVSSLDLGSPAGRLMVMFT